MPRLEMAARRRIRGRPRRSRPGDHADGDLSIDEAFLAEQQAAKTVGESAEGEAGEAAKPGPVAASGAVGAAGAASAAEPVGEVLPELDEGAVTFGESGKAWMTVEIPEDGSAATLTALSFGGTHSATLLRRVH